MPTIAQLVLLSRSKYHPYYGHIVLLSLVAMIKDRNVAIYELVFVAVTAGLTVIYLKLILTTVRFLPSYADLVNFITSFHGCHVRIHSLPDYFGAERLAEIFAYPRNWKGPGNRLIQHPEDWVVRRRTWIKKPSWLDRWALRHLSKNMHLISITKGKKKTKKLPDCFVSFSLIDRSFIFLRDSPELLRETPVSQSAVARFWIYHEAGHVDPFNIFELYSRRHYVAQFWVLVLWAIPLLDWDSVAIGSLCALSIAFYCAADPPVLPREISEAFELKADDTLYVGREASADAFAIENTNRAELSVLSKLTARMPGWLKDSRLGDAGNELRLLFFERHLAATLRDRAKQEAVVGDHMVLAPMNPVRTLLLPVSAIILGIQSQLPEGAGVHSLALWGLIVAFLLIFIPGVIIGEAVSRRLNTGELGAEFAALNGSIRTLRRQLSARDGR